MKIIGDLKKRIRNDSSILLYPSSCRYHDEFEALPVDIVILCSNDFAESKSIGKVFCVKCYNNLLLRTLHENNIKISVGVLIRDGSVEGGNCERTNTATFFGRAAPRTAGRVMDHN